MTITSKSSIFQHSYYGLLGLVYTIISIANMFNLSKLMESSIFILAAPYLTILMISLLLFDTVNARINNTR